jgi:hypothetical protein
VPFEFTGVRKINLATEEVILEPPAQPRGRLGDACAALTA